MLSEFEQILPEFKQIVVRVGLNIDGVWSNVGGMWLNIDGVWSNVVGVWLNIDGVWSNVVGVW